MEANGNVSVFYHTVTKTQGRPLNPIQAQVEIFKFKNKELSEYLIWTPGWDHWQNLSQFLKSNQKYFVYSQPSIPGLHPPPLPIGFPEDTISQVTQTQTLTTEIPTAITDSPYTEVVTSESSIQKKDYGFYGDDFKGDNFSITDIRKSEKKLKKLKSKSEKLNRRNFSRLDLKLEIILVSRTHTFKTYSQNISLGGTLLVDDVPKDFFKSSFDLLIINILDPNPNTGRLLFKAKILGELLESKRLRFIEVDKSMTSKLQALLNAYVTYQKMTDKKVG